MPKTIAIAGKTIFKPIAYPIEGKIQGNVFFIERVRGGRVWLRGVGSFEVDIEGVEWAAFSEFHNLSGLAEFTELPNGRKAVDWIV